MNDRKDAVNIFRNLMVPEAQNTIAVLLQIMRACLVMRLHGIGSMLSAIQFDDQLNLRRREISDERPNGMLLAEFYPQLFATEIFPEVLFDICHGFSELPCML